MKKTGEFSAETFEKSLKILGIEKYSEQIINSNSQGEIFHLLDYLMLAEMIGENDWFSGWFDTLIEYSKSWERPESIFQHVPEILNKAINESELSK